MNRGPEILSLAAKRGIHLSLRGDRIRWRADDGMDNTVERAIREFRDDVVAELERRAAEEQQLIADYADRERMAQQNARIRMANGTDHPRDCYLAAGESIASADRRSRSSTTNSEEGK